jgi:adenylyltransferase/sulfurtransferase
MKFRELKLRPNPERPVIDKLIDYQEFCGVGGTAPGQEEAGAVESISVSELNQGGQALVLSQPTRSAVPTL